MHSHFRYRGGARSCERPRDFRLTEALDGFDWTTNDKSKVAVEWHTFPPTNHPHPHHCTSMSKFCRTRIRVSICIFILFVLPSVLANSSNPLLRGSDNGSPAEESLGRDTWPRHRKLVLAANGTSTINEWIIMFKGDRGKILQRILNDKAKIVYEFRKFLNAIVVAGLSTAALNWLLERDEILLIEQVSGLRVQF